MSMGLLDRLIGKQPNSSPVIPPVFSFMYGKQAPEMKAREYLMAYKGWVYSCVNAISEDIGSIDIYYYRITSQGVVRDDMALPYKLINDVNPAMTSGELFTATQAYLELAGNSYWYLPRGSVTKKPGEIWILDPTRMTIVKSVEKLVGGYIYRTESGKEVPLSVDEVLHFKRFNPLNMYYGMGTVQAAALAIDTDNFAANWNKNFFYNSAVPSAALETSGTLSQEQYERLKAKWDSTYTGVDNAHKLVILQGGLTYKPINLTQKEMQFLESRRFTRDEILGMFRVPKTVLGLTDDVNRANAEASEYVFEKRVIKPRIQFIVDRLNEFLLPMFGISPDQGFFDYEDPVPENEELELREYDTAINKWMTVNEVREEEGLPPISNGDTIFVNSLLLPLGSPQEITKMQKVLKGVSEEQLKAVDQRIKYEARVVAEYIPKYKKDYQFMAEGVAHNLETMKSIKGKKARPDDIIRTAFSGFEALIAPFGKTIEDHINQVLPHAATTLISRLGSQVEFDPKNERAMQYIETRGGQLIKTVDSTSRDEMMKIIQSGMEQGKGPYDIARDIRSFYDQGDQWMAKRVARTETAYAYAEGSHEAAMEDKNVVSKRWLLTVDACEECIQNEADGWISKDSAFSSGDYAEPVHPNCRCTVEYGIGEPEKSATYHRAIVKAEKEINKRAALAVKDLEQVREASLADAEKIVHEAREAAEKIIADARDQALAEKKKATKELIALKDKAMGLVYGEKE